MKKLSLYVLLLIGYSSFAQGDENLVDGVVAVIGENMILKSEIEEQYASFLQSGKPVNDNTRCELFEELLFSKLLLGQAEEDSLFVGEDQINSEIDRRLRYFISQFGSKEKLEEFYEKSVEEIRIEFHDPIQEQLMTQRMQEQISGNASVSPGEVRAFYDEIPKDSLPEISAQIELNQLVRKPPINEGERDKARNKLLEFRKRIVEGEDFGTLAYLYSEDPGSARENGQLGFMSRSELVSEFAAVAFNLEKEEVSGVVETEFGFHLIKMNERSGQKVSVSHILISPKVVSGDLLAAKYFLDSMKNSIQTIDTLTFELAATLFSEDKETRFSGGIIVNPLSGSAKFEMEQVSQIDPSLYLMIDKLKVGDIAGPELAQMRDGSRVYRIVMLKDVTDAHTANLKQDYQFIQTLALNKKQSEVMNEWISSHVNRFYLKVDERYNTCKFKYNWISTTAKADKKDE